jgi:hypothetical protein
MTGKKGPLDTFAIAGQDKKFVWADATIKDNTITVSAKNVPNPVAVRYAWAMNPSQRNLLYNKEGIPASPFRTDTWPLFDTDNYVPAEQIKPVQPKDYDPIPLDRPSVSLRLSDNVAGYVVVFQWVMKDTPSSLTR